MAEEILSFVINIDVKLSEGSKETLDELKGKNGDISDNDVKKRLDELQNEINELKKPKEKTTTAKSDAESLLESEGELTADQLAEIKSTVAEELGGLNDADMLQFAAMAKNPQGAIGNIVGKLFAGQAAVIMGPLLIAVAAPVVTAEIIKAMSVKGGPLNRDWRRFIEKEVEVGLSRVQQKEKELGISQTILTQIVGFKPNNVNFTYNSLYLVNDSRVARIGLSDREAGVSISIVQ